MSAWCRHYYAAVHLAIRQHSLTRIWKVNWKSRPVYTA